MSKRFCVFCNKKIKFFDKKSEIMDRYKRKYRVHTTCLINKNESDHEVCEECGMCVTCGDCNCKREEDLR